MQRLKRLSHSRLKRASLAPIVRGAIVAVLAVAVLSGGALAAWAAVVSIPTVDNFENRRVAESTKIYDRTGTVLLFDVHGTMRRTAVPLEDIAIHIRNATIAIEDDSFYQHKGFRPLSFARALLVNISTGSYSQGGSTITQQVVKNTLLTHDKTLVRKAKEIVLAMKLERSVPKDEILRIYLNETSYGGTIYGVEEASRYFYGKPASDVTLAEAAYLAALPQAPTRYSPYGNRRDELEARKNLVLLRMREIGFITDEEYEEALAKEVEFQDTKEAGIKAPHFVFFIREYLEETYGPEAVAQGGLRVITTLDWELQQAAEEIVERYAHENERRFNAENAGLVAVDPKNGQILVMVGSRGYFDEGIDGKVNVTIAKRQPGSAFKPFIYAAAFEKGYTPDTILFDLRTQFSTRCSPSDYLNSTTPCYSPVNYDNEYRGPMTIRNALAQSVNVPAVKALYLVGVPEAIKMAERLGITTLEGPGRYGLSLVLGGGEVMLLDMVSAYATFANDGVRTPPAGILEVRDAARNLLESHEPRAERALEPQIARLISDVLSDNEARTPLYGPSSPLYFPGYDVAAKTGTTNDNMDAWVIGYSSSIAAGAWAGNNQPESMNQISGLIVTPLWSAFMKLALEKYPPEPFPQPAPIANYDSLPPVLRGEWNSNPAEGVHSILHWVNKANPTGPRLTNPAMDSQYAYWELPVQLWAGQLAPSGGDDGNFSITSPAPGSVSRIGEPLQVSVFVAPEAQVSRVSFFLNGGLVGVANQPPFSFSFAPEGGGPLQLSAVFDTPSGPVERSVTIMVTEEE